MNMKAKEQEKILKLFSVDSFGKKIQGCDGCIIPTVIYGKKVYFKFLPKEWKDRIKKEIEIVKILKNNGCKVPEYFEFNKNIIFEDDDEIFYASYEVSGIPYVEDMNIDILKDIVIELARMHKVLKKIPVDDEKESDINRFHTFYNNNRLFFENENLSLFIDDILENVFEEEAYSYIHADVNFRNIFVQDGHLTSFIDFTDLRVGYLEDDLGKLFQNILYLDLTGDKLNELILAYEKELGQKINRDNLLLSIIFRIMYRYFGFVNNNEGNKEEYKEKTERILQKILRR